MSKVFTKKEIELLKRMRLMNESIVVKPKYLGVALDGFSDEEMNGGVYYKREEDFDYDEFGIANLKEFLSAVTLLSDKKKECDIILKKDHLLLKNDEFELKYLTQDPDKIPSLHLEDWENDNGELSYGLISMYEEYVQDKIIFNFNWEKIEKFHKLSSAFNINKTFFIREGNDIVIKASDRLDEDAGFKNVVKSTAEIMETVGDVEDFTICSDFNWSLLYPDNYEIELSAGVVKLTGEKSKVVYVFPTNEFGEEDIIEGFEDV